MKILALDTSSVVATVAVLEDEKLVGEYTLNHKLTHSQKLIPMIEELMKNCEIKPKDIDIFAVSLGPGSFTGLRIGAATIKAMAQALGKPVVGIPTLEALANNIQYSGELICPIIDAQKNLVYSAVYSWGQSECVEENQQEVYEIEGLIKHLQGLSRKIIFVGDAVDKYRDDITSGLGDYAIIPPMAMRMPKAASVALLALKKAKAGEIKGAGDLVPIYMRKSQAENQYEEKLKAMVDGGK